jgi:tetratricopeptide (TPR) repeat protein
LDNATTLDPRFISVYEFGATVLPAIDKERAIKLLEKGIVDNPNEWKLYQHLGYIYWRLGNFEKASETYAAGAKIPNAPKFMQMMTAKTKTEGGSRETARAIYQQMFDKAEDEQVRKTAELRLAEIDSLEEREHIQKVLQEFQEKNNRCAHNWREILPLLQTVKLPNAKDFRLDQSNNLVDPTNAPYILDKESCTIKLDLAKTKIPLK